MATLRIWLNDRQIKELQSKVGTKITLVPQLQGKSFKAVHISGLTKKQRIRDKRLGRI